MDRSNRIFEIVLGIIATGYMVFLFLIITRPFQTKNEVWSECVQHRIEEDKDSSVCEELKHPNKNKKQDCPKWATDYNKQLHHGGFFTSPEDGRSAEIFYDTDEKIVFRIDGETQYEIRKGERINDLAPLAQAISQNSSRSVETQKEIERCK